jgi:hypothetical protein
MKRAVGLSLLLVLATTLTAQATIDLGPGDTITLESWAYSNGQPAYEGYGGAFDWQVASTSSIISPAQTSFQSFCVEIQQDIWFGGIFTVSDIFQPQLHQAINSPGSNPQTSPGNILNNFQGIYLFDLWSEGGIPSNVGTPAQVAGAVQIALWESEGYTLNDPYSNGYVYGSFPGGAGYYATGYTDGQLTNANTLISSLSQVALPDGSATGYNTNWAPNDVSAIILTDGTDGNGGGAQDQVVLVDDYTPAGGTSSVPEPISIVVWGVGAGLAGAAALRRRKQPRGRWSPEDRQAIFQVIEGKR